MINIPILVMQEKCGTFVGKLLDWPRGMRSIIVHRLAKMEEKIKLGLNISKVGMALFLSIFPDVVPYPSI